MALPLDGNAASILDQDNLSIVLYFRRVASRSACKPTDRQTMGWFGRRSADAVRSLRYRKSWRGDRGLPRYPARRFLCYRSWLSGVLVRIQLVRDATYLRGSAYFHSLD